MTIKCKFVKVVEFIKQLNIFWFTVLTVFNSIVQSQGARLA